MKGRQKLNKKLENKDIVIKGKGIKVNILSGIFIAIGVITMVISIFVIKKILPFTTNCLD